MPARFPRRSSTLQLGHLANEDNSWHKASVKFAEEVERLTDGRIAVEVFPNESLGKEIDLINGMQLGTVDMTITGESLQNWAPMAALLAVPYAYGSLEQMDEVASGEIGEEIEQQIVERAQIRPIAYFARGPRELTSNRPIETPRRPQRSQDARSERAALRRCLVRARRAADADGLLRGLHLAPERHDRRAGEPARPDSLGQLRRGAEPREPHRSRAVVDLPHDLRADLVASFPKRIRQAVEEAAQIAQDYERELFLESLDADRAYLEEQGMTFVEVDNAAFAEKARDAVLSNVTDEIRPTVEQLFESQSE